MKNSKIIKLIAFLIIGLSFGIFSHFMALGYLMSENYLIETVSEVSIRTISVIAAFSGYDVTRHQVLSELSPIESISLNQIVREEASGKINPGLVYAVLYTESENNLNAISPKGAIGLMQIMPINAKGCGLQSPSQLFDMRLNIRCGIKILIDSIIAEGDVQQGLQRYNGGPGCVSVCLESLDFSRKVFNRLSIDEDHIAIAKVLQASYTENSKVVTATANGWKVKNVSSKSTLKGDTAEMHLTKSSKGKHGQEYSNSRTKSLKYAAR